MTESLEKAGVNPETQVGHIDSRVIHDGRVVHLSVDRVRFPDGREGELELIRHRGASAVVPKGSWSSFVTEAPRRSFPFWGIWTTRILNWC